MTSAFPPVVNVAHVAAGQGQKCARCGVGLGMCRVLLDDSNTVVDRDWEPNERVIEYEAPNGRTYFADQCTGFAVDCQP